MSESFEKAVEAASLVLLGRTIHSANTVRVALTAALPHLTAQDVPHVAREAWDEGAQTAWGRSTPTVNGQNYYWRTSGEPVNPYAEEADHE